MYKKMILGLTILSISGCTPKTTVVPQVISQPIVTQQIVVRKALLDTIREFEKTYEIGLNIQLPNSVKMGKFVNLMATPSVDGYLKLVVINPNDKASTVLPNRYDSGFIRANSTLNTDHKDFGIQTFPPKGLHHILVLFSEKKTHSNDAILSTLQNVQNGEYGRAYVKLFAIDIY